MRWRRPLVLFATYWTISAGVLAATYVARPPDPMLQGTDRYGRTVPGDLERIIVVVAVEILVFGLLLRPWSYARSWGRALVSLGLLIPWILLQLMIGIHAGPLQRVHTDLLLLLWLALLAAAIVGGSAEAQSWRATRRQAAP